MKDDARQLEDLLDRELELARRLTTVLAAERAALVGTAPDAVTAAAGEKCAILNLLEKLEAERRELCADTQQALPPLRSATPAQSVPHTVAERWRSLMDLMSGCRTANEINGQIIHVRQSQTRQLIDILRGGPAVTYGPRGKTFSTALRALARA
jgi:flagellar biosynthesis/type III secretory pathway chaperone